MKPLLHEIRHNPLLWLLVFVPAVLAAERLAEGAQTLLFVLSVLAIVPLAALLSHATESVAAKTGDAVGGLLSATLGNLTELIIGLAALRAGEYTLVKASLAGAIVANTLFVLGGSFLLGGLKHHTQEFNRATARVQAGLLFLATVALMIPSAIAKADDPARAVRFWEGVLDTSLASRNPDQGEGWQSAPGARAVGVHARASGPGDRVSLPYFAVADLAVALTRVVELGGAVIHAGGRWAICRDSEGSPFGLGPIA